MFISLRTVGTLIGVVIGVKNNNLKAVSAIMDMINAILIEVLGSIAENERNKIRSRQREGIEAARKRKVRLGRPALIKPVNFDSIAARVESKELTVAQAIKILKISRSSYYRFLHDSF